MKNRIFALILTFSTACASLAFLAAYLPHDGSVTLSELSALDTGIRRPTPGLDELAQPVPDGKVLLARLEPESLFYGVLGICGVLLALRAVIFALRMAGENYSLKRQAPTRAQSSEQKIEAAVEHRDATRVSRPRAETDIAMDTGESAPGWWERRRQFFSGRVPAHWLPYPHGLTGRMMVSFTGIVMAFGLLTIAIVYFTLTASLGKHVIERARITAVNASDSVPGYLLKKDMQGLRELLRKHASRPEVAYILVQDRAGQILAHSAPALPQEVQAAPPAAYALNGAHRVFRVGDGEVEELSVRILEGQEGIVRLGIWREEVDAEISRAVTPLIKILSFVIGGGILAVIYFVRRINRPIIRLVKAAQIISCGDLEAPSLGTDDKTEFGELSRALERMRSSIKAALIRLREEQ
jgi:HAMP domain-containing protein